MDVKIKGIDVSTWQGTIDWAKVAGDGVKFAMIRLGYGSKNGTACSVDKYFHKNVENALANGVAVGCYFYSYALSVEAVKKEAAFVVQQLAKHKGRILYPIAYDIEDKTQIGLGKATLTAMVAAFCSAVEAAGYYASFYTNVNWARNYLNINELARFDMWLAQWASAPTYTGRPFNMWQSTSSGRVAGISGDVDMNTAYIDFEAHIKEKKLNGYTGSTPSTGTSKPNADTKPNTEKAPDKVNKLTVDGIWGTATTKRLQQIFGTPVDGKVSNQWACYKTSNPGLGSGWEWQTKPNGKGSALIKAMQKWAGMAAGDRDGIIGPKTIRAIQAKLGTPVDGKVSNPSAMVKALQKWANNQK